MSLMINLIILGATIFVAYKVGLLSFLFVKLKELSEWFFKVSNLAKKETTTITKSNKHLRKFKKSLSLSKSNDEVV